jgi:hypothetical protein
MALRTGNARDQFAPEDYTDDNPLPRSEAELPIDIQVDIAFRRIVLDSEFSALNLLRTIAIFLEIDCQFSPPLIIRAQEGKDLSSQGHQSNTQVVSNQPVLGF